eukprot:scaffold63927_cov37-Cyclotella_meneghiniana.AAC.1
MRAIANCKAALQGLNELQQIVDNAQAKIHNQTAIPRVQATTPTQQQVPRVHDQQDQSLPRVQVTTTATATVKPAIAQPQVTHNRITRATAQKSKYRRLRAAHTAPINCPNQPPAKSTRSHTAKIAKSAIPTFVASTTPKPGTSQRSQRVSRLKQPTKATIKRNLHQALSAQLQSPKGRKTFMQQFKQMERETERALAVLDEESGKLLKYKQLMTHPKYKKDWQVSAADEFGRLAQGVGGRIQNPTDTFTFIREEDIPKDRKKDVTYGSFTCSVRPEKADPNRTRFTAGGDKINYPGEEIIQEYKLREKANKKGCIFLKVVKGMYGLPQAGLLANQLLEKRLNKHGYYQSKIIPGLWKHKTRPIQFTLVVDDFGVKYVGKEHAEHLKRVLEEHYKVTADWAGERYVGIHLKWDYDKRQCHLYMPGYVKKSLIQFGHKIEENLKQNQPFPHTPIKYGATKQYAKEPKQSPPLDARNKKFIQKVCGKLLFLARAVDSTLLTPISAIAAQCAEPTEETMKQTKQLLDYIASQEEAVITYNKSNMILAVHSDASYLSEPKARSRAGGHFFLSHDTDNPPNNGAILNIAHIIKHVMSSATEAELAALYIMAREAVYIRIILEEMGHKQPPTPIQTDNAMAEGVINSKITPKRTKAMDMRFHWLRDRE